MQQTREGVTLTATFWGDELKGVRSRRTSSGRVSRPARPPERWAGASWRTSGATALHRSGLPEFHGEVQRGASQDRTSLPVRCNWAGRRLPARRPRCGSRRTTSCRCGLLAARRARTTSGRWTGWCTPRSERRPGARHAAHSAASGRRSPGGAHRDGLADADPVQGEHAADRRSFPVRQRRDVRAGAVVVVVIGGSARLLAAERDEDDGQPGPGAATRPRRGPAGPPPGRVVLGAGSLRNGVEMRSDDQVRFARVEAAQRRDQVHRRPASTGTPHENRAAPGTAGGVRRGPRRVSCASTHAAAFRYDGLLASRGPMSPAR